MKELVITRYDSFTIALNIENDITMKLDCFSGCQLRVGTVYVGKVESICRNINAFFVRISENDKVFVPFGKNTLFHYADERVHNRIPKCNDEILVMIKKPASGSKETEATPVLSVDGFLCTISCEEKGILISSKIDKKTAAYLKNEIEKLSEYQNRNFKVIVRSNYLLLSDSTLLMREVEERIRVMADVIHNGKHESLYSVSYRPGPPYLENLKELFYLKYDRVITDDTMIYEEVEKFHQKFMNNCSFPICYYNDQAVSLKVLKKIDTRVKEAFSLKVWLPCGGYLVIAQTEAMVVVDVNSGKADAKKEKNDCFLMINKEAAKELMHQLQLKNLSGIIVVDFLKMKEEKSWEEVTEIIKSEALSDPNRTRFVDVTPLGLIEITREKSGLSLIEQNDSFFCKNFNSKC